MENCPTRAITHDEAGDTRAVDDAHCIRCRQCEIASNGAFELQQPWQGKVERWRMRHAPVRSAAWMTALGKMAEEKGRSHTIAG